MAKRDSPLDPPSRRVFLLGLTAATGLSVVPEAFAATPDPVTAEAAPIQAAAAGKAGSEVDAVMALLTARYDSYLQAADLTAIRHGVERVHRNVNELLKVPIHNGDAPDSLFIPDGL
jgi:hypothetical protein